MSEEPPGGASSGPPAAAGQRSASEDLRRLQRGEITAEQYIESRVERALARLAGLLTDEQREVVREVVLSQALVDPAVQVYLERAVGPAAKTDLR